MIIRPRCSHGKNWKIKQNGFTLIELLVVIAIIGVLSSIVWVNVRKARAKARDVVRIQTVKQIQTAVELYYADNGQAPPIQHMLTGFDDPPTWNCGHNDRWCALESMLSPYLGELPKEDEPADNNSIDDIYYYMYYASSGDGYQKYGVGVMLEDSSNPIALNDGGFYPGAFEVGPAVTYCMNKYSGGDADWFWKSPNWNYVCEGGN